MAMCPGHPIENRQGRILADPVRTLNLCTASSVAQTSPFILECSPVRRRQNDVANCRFSRSGYWFGGDIRHLLCDTGRLITEASRGACTHRAAACRAGLRRSVEKCRNGLWDQSTSILPASHGPSPRQPSGPTSKSGNRRRQPASLQTDAA